MEIGAQMFTVRKTCQTLEELDATLGRIAEIGYRNVQVSGTCAYEGEWMAAALKKHGLSCVITHYNKDELVADAAAVIAKHKAIGCAYIGLGAYKDIFANLDAFDRELRPVMEKVRDAGCLYMYHNHGKEFEKLPDGRTVLEYLRDTYAPDLLGFTLDTYWIQHGGASPVDVMRAFAGRIPCVHFKDMGYLGKEQKMLPVGDGNIRFEPIVNACADGGTKYILVEQDDCNGEDPIDCLRRSYRYLSSLGLS